MKLDWFKNSTKGKFMGLSAITVFLYAFLTFVVFGFDGGSSFWISFSFAIISIILAYFISYLSVNAARRLTDWIFSLPVMRWCVMYVIVEIIIATIFMIIHAPWKIVFIPQFLLPIFFLILVVPCFGQKNHVAEVSVETSVKVSYIRQLNAKLIALISRTEDSALKKEMEKATDMLRHSDPMSADSLTEIEEKMSACANQIDSLIREKNYTEAAPLVKEMCLLIEERNQLVIAAKLIQY